MRCRVFQENDFNPEQLAELQALDKVFLLWSSERDLLFRTVCIYRTQISKPIRFDPEFHAVCSCYVLDLYRQVLQSAGTSALRYIQEDGGPDIDTWKIIMAQYVETNSNWLDTPWLTAEFYFYRCARHHHATKPMYTYVKQATCF